MKKLSFFCQLLFVMIALLFAHDTGAQVLTIQPFTLYTNDGAKVIELEKDGAIHVFEQTVGRLSKNGQVRDINDALLASLDKQGFLKDSADKVLGKLLAGGSWDNGSGTINHFNKDGVYTIREDLFLQLSPNDKKIYKTASLLVVLTFYINNVKVSSETDPESNPEVVLVLSQSPGSPGTISYEYTVYADGKISTTGYTHHTTKYRISPEQLATLLAAAKDIDMETLASNAKPLPFVHDGQVLTLKLRQNNRLHTVHFGPGSDFMPQSVETYLRYANSFLVNALSNK
jgi:hypothetical protein